MAIAAEIAPGGRDAPENDGRDARRMEVADDRRRLVRGYVTVLEPQPPDADDRLALADDVGWAVGQVKIPGQVRPILLYGLQRRGALHAGNVIHDEEAAPVHLAGRSRVGQNDVEVLLEVRVSDVRQEPLH